MVCIAGPDRTVSIIMGVYNGATFLSESIDSILAQTFADLELVVVDDGSTDESPAILRQAANRDPRVMIMVQEHLGAPRALNAALMCARGRYIARQRQRDLSAPQRLERQVSFLERQPEVALVGSYGQVIDEYNVPSHDLVVPLSNEELQKSLLVRDCFVSESVLVRREALREVGGYREEFPLGGDLDLALRVAQRYPVANIPEVMYRARRTAADSSTRLVRLEELYTVVARELAGQRQTAGSDILMRIEER